MTEKLNKSGLAKKLGISHSSLYYESKKDIKDWVIKGRIEKALTSNPYYGYKRIAIELAANKKKILWAMKKCGPKALKRKQRFVKIGDIGLPAAEYENEIGAFCPPTPDVVWCGDFTYIWFKDSFIYLATVIDVYIRGIIGFSLSRRHDRFLVKSAALDVMKK